MPAGANRSMPRWIVGASSIVSSTVSTSRASPQRPTAMQPTASAASTSGSTAAGSPIAGPSSASEVVDRSRTIGTGASARTGATARLTSGRSTGPRPAASRSASVASANGTAATASSAAHSACRDSMTYALSGSSEAWWSPLIATDAARATTSGHSAASSASVSGSAPVKPRVSSVAIRSGWATSNIVSAAIVTARSDTSHVRDRSPKSMIPEGTRRPAASRVPSVFWSVMSAWTTWTRSRGISGSSAVIARAIDASSSARRSGVEANGASASQMSAACLRSHWNARSSPGWSKPASASASSAPIAPCARSTAAEKYASPSSGTPSMNVTRRRSWVAPADVVAATISEPSSAGTGTGTANDSPAAARCARPAFSASSSGRVIPWRAILRTNRPSSPSTR